MVGGRWLVLVVSRGELSSNNSIANKFAFDTTRHEKDKTFSARNTPETVFGISGLKKKKHDAALGGKTKKKMAFRVLLKIRDKYPSLPPPPPPAL